MLFEQHDIAFAHFCQVIGDTAAQYAATNDYDSGSIVAHKFAIRFKP
jgi:hypothetical protein